MSRTTDSDAARSPQLSVVIYYKRPAAFLNEALESVVDQLNSAVELIVVAGQSANEDLGIERRYLSSINRLITEPDQGGWEAANKGWRAAQGTWVQFLMSDDILPPGSIAQTLFFLSAQRADLVCGGMAFFSDDHGVPRIIREVPAQPLTLERVLGDLCSPSVLYRRDFLTRMNGFDGRYRYSHDRELLLRAHVGGVSTAILPHDIYHMRVHSRSRTTSGNTTVISTYLPEHVQFADSALSEIALSERARQTLRQWRDEELVKLYIARLFARSGGARQPPAMRLPVFCLARAFARVLTRRLRRAVTDPRKTFVGLLSRDHKLE